MMVSNPFMKISDGLNRFIRWLTVVSVAGFTLLVFAAVCSRYLFNFSILFSQEVSKLLFVWACFMGATVAYKQKAHIRFEFIDRLLSAKGLLRSDLLVHSASLVFFAVVLVQSHSHASQIWETYFPVIGYSQGWLYVAVVTASAVFLVHNLAFWLDSFLNLKGSRAGEMP